MTAISRRSKVAITFIAMFGCGAAIAQEIPPTVGAAVREIEQKRPDVPALNDPSLRVSARARTAMRTGPGVTFVVSSVRISGATAFSDMQLLPMVSALAGHEVSLADLESAAARVTQFYHQHGYPVARAYVPAQQIQDSSVEIAVLEGRYGHVDVRNTSRLSEGLIRSTLGVPSSDELIQTTALEHDLLLLDDLAGVATSATLTSGERVGTSDLILDIIPDHPFAGTLEADNFGNRYTGETRFGGSIAAANLAGRGDLLSVRGLISQDTGIWYGRAGYQIPVTGSGLRLGAAFSHTNYSLGEEFKSLDADGDADIYTAFSVYPAIRSTRGNLDVQMSFNYFDLNDEINATNISNPRTLSSYVIGLTGYIRDAVLGGGVNAASIAIASGNLDLKNTLASQIDAVTARIDGNFKTLVYSVLRLQSVTDQLQLYVALQGQYASKNLDPSQKFVLGGPNAVRAYSEGEGVGDAGLLATAELRYALPSLGWLIRPQVFAFFDGGSISVNENQFSPGQNDIDLYGAGLGFDLDLPQSFAVRGSLAWRVGSDSALEDSNSTSQAWIRIVRSF